MGKCFGILVQSEEGFPLHLTPGGCWELSSRGKKLKRKGQKMVDLKNLKVDDRVWVCWLDGKLVRPFKTTILSISSDRLDLGRLIWCKRTPDDFQRNYLEKEVHLTKGCALVEFFQH